MPVYVTRAVSGCILTEIPFVADVYQDERDGAQLEPLMSIVAVERSLRSSKEHADLFSPDDLLLFLEEGRTNPVVDKISDGTLLALVVQKGRPDYHLKNLFDSLQHKDASELNGPLLSLKQSIVRLPDAEMPDGWRYLLR